MERYKQSRRHTPLPNKYFTSNANFVLLPFSLSLSLLPKTVISFPCFVFLGFHFFPFFAQFHHRQTNVSNTRIGKIFPAPVWLAQTDTNTTATPSLCRNPHYQSTLQYLHRKDVTLHSIDDDDPCVCVCRVSSAVKIRKLNLTPIKGIVDCWWW